MTFSGQTCIVRSADTAAWRATLQPENMFLPLLSKCKHFKRRSPEKQSFVKLYYLNPCCLLFLSENCVLELRRNRFCSGGQNTALAFHDKTGRMRRGHTVQHIFLTLNIKIFKGKRTNTKFRAHLLWHLTVKNTCTLRLVILLV